MNILVINCGSSSLKFQLIDAQSEKLIAKGLCERIAIEGSRLVYTPAGGEKQVTEAPMKDWKKFWTPLKRQRRDCVQMSASN